MKNFILIICLQVFAFSALAGMTCEGLFNQKTKVAQTPVIDKAASLKALNQLDYPEHFERKKNAKNLAIINDLIKKNMLNDPNLAYSVVLYLSAFKPYYSREYFKTIERIINNKNIFPLLATGQRIKFKDPLIEERIDGFLKGTDTVEGWIATWDIYNLKKPDIAYKLWINMVRPSEKFDLALVTNALTRQMLNIRHSDVAYRDFTQLARSIPQYNLFKAVKSSLKQSILKIPDHYQEVMIVRDNLTGLKSVLVVSSRPIKDADANMFGISIKVLQSFDINTTLENKTFTWFIDGKTSYAQVTYKIMGTTNIRIASKKAPDYEQMLQNKKLTGIVAISNNLNDFSETLGKIYLEYLQSEKFKIESTQVLSGSKIREFILQSTEASEIDYMIREGHSESGNDNMLSLSERMKIHKLVLNRGKYQEEIYLIIPIVKAHSALDDTLELTTFGQALRSRNNNNQFIYQDASCNGNCSMPGIYRKVAAPGFVPLSSSTMLSTFVPEDGNVVYEVLSGLRSGSDYKTIRKRVKDFNKPDEDGDQEDLLTPDMGDEYMETETTRNIDITDLKIKRFFNQTPPEDNP